MMAGLSPLIWITGGVLVASDGEDEGEAGDARGLIGGCQNCGELGFGDTDGVRVIRPIADAELLRCDARCEFSTVEASDRDLLIKLLDRRDDRGDEVDVVEAERAVGRQRGRRGRRDEVGEDPCTCWAMKPSWGLLSSLGSIQLKVTGLSALISARELEPSRSWILVLRRWSELWVKVPPSCALPPSKTANTVVDEVLTTAKAEVELRRRGPRLRGGCRVWWCRCRRCSTR